MAENRTAWMAVPTLHNGLEREMVATKDRGTAGVLRGEYTTYRRFVMWRLNVDGIEGVSYNVYAKVGDQYVLLVVGATPRPQNSPRPQS